MYSLRGHLRKVLVGIVLPQNVGSSCLRMLVGTRLVLSNVRWTVICTVIWSTVCVFVRVRVCVVLFIGCVLYGVLTAKCVCV